MAHDGPLDGFWTKGNWNLNDQKKRRGKQAKLKRQRVKASQKLHTASKNFGLGDGKKNRPPPPPKCTGGGGGRGVGGGVTQEKKGGVRPGYPHPKKGIGGAKAKSRGAQTCPEENQRSTHAGVREKKSGRGRSQLSATSGL